VDDDTTFRSLVREKLIDKFGEGTVIYEAGNGVEAMKIVESNILDFILMDASMPEMDGRTCAELIRSSKAVVQPKVTSFYFIIFFFCNFFLLSLSDNWSFSGWI
jgi:CheY-like chemotaxis protein